MSGGGRDTWVIGATAHCAESRVLPSTSTETC